MAEIPQFSIITPVLNGFRFLSFYVKCLQAQTFTDWEAIVVDDGSSDGTIQFFRHLTCDDSRFTLVCNTRLREVSGPYQARNVGLALARGAFICFLDIDDYWAPRKLEYQQACIARNPCIKLIFSDYIRASRGSMRYKVRRLPSLFTPHVLMHFLNPVPMLTSCVQRSSVECLSFQPCNHEDYLFWHSVFRGLRPEEIYHSRELYAVYTVDSASLSGNKLRSAGWIWLCYRRLGYGKCLAFAFVGLRGILQFWFTSCEILGSLFGSSTCTLLPLASIDKVIQ